MDLVTMRSVVAEAVLDDVETCRRELDHLRAARGVLDAREVEVLRRLDELAASRPGLFPDDMVARAANTGLARASRVRDRMRACEEVPELAAVLAEGATTGERVDVLARATAGLSPAERSRVAAHGPALATAAATATPRDYRTLVERVVGQARVDDGLARLARQRRATQLRWWTGTDGMWHLAGRFDPVRGTELEGRLRAGIERLFHDPPDDEAPADPLERQQHRAALALLELSCGRNRSGRPEVTVLVDERTLIDGHHEGSLIDTGTGGFGIPVETVRRWACEGTVAPVVSGVDGVRLLLGHETRLANRHQRRALRVLYRTCALCEAPFEHCQVHHVDWHRRDGGPTDIDNLLPLCNRHHHRVHEGGRHLTLAPDRTLTITRPDGTSTHDPPRIRAA